MNPEIKAQWVAALRSGKYHQGRGGLRNNLNEFCCLGVLCDLHAKATGNTWTPPCGEHQVFRYDGGDVILPPLVQTWAGLPESPRVRVDRHTESLCVRNDNHDTFEQIADRIEKDLVS